MRIETVEEVLSLFERHPTLTVLMVLVGALAWAMKTDALGFVSKRKRQRRADVFDTYEKLDAMNGVSEVERAALLVQLREAAEGLPPPLLAAPAGDTEPENKDADLVVLPPSTRRLTHIADGVLAVFTGSMVAGILVMLLAVAIGGIAMIATSDGDIHVLAVGLVLTSMNTWLIVHLGSELLRGLTKKFPRHLTFLDEGMDWIAQCTELARSLGMLAFVALLHLGSVAFMLFFAAAVFIEFDGLGAWVAAIGLGSVGLAFGVKSTLKGLELLGAFGAEEAGT